MSRNQQSGTKQERIARLVEQSVVLWDNPVPMMIHSLPARAPVQETAHRPRHLHRTSQLHRPMPVRCFGY